MADQVDPRRFVVYEAGGENVIDEAEVLSSDGSRRLFGFVRRVYEGKEDYEKLQVWQSYDGVPLFRAESEGELMIFAVEQVSSRSDTRISIMFVGTRAKAYSGLCGTWDGADDAALWNVVRQRCQRHFF